MHPDDLAETRAEVRRISESDTPSSYECRCRKKDGFYRRISWVTVANTDYFYGSGRDITVEHDALQKLKELEETIYHLQKMDSLTHLMGGIAHELNNKMQGIVASLELVRKLIAVGRNAEVERFLVSAIGSAQTAASLNHRVLDFSRYQAVDPKPQLFNQLIAAWMTSAPPVAQATKLEVIPSNELWETHCDGNQAETALLNLVLNARDAMPNGGTITVQTSNVTGTDTAGERLAGPEQYVCITVTDAGMGMSQDALHRAFTDKGTEHGIGRLTAVARFARDNNGDTSIDSELGKGTSVKLYLPRYQRVQTTVPQPAPDR